MITKSKWDKDFGDTWEVECDDCGEMEEIDGDFDDCITFIKENKWATRKEDGDWLNYCPDCQNKKQEGSKQNG